jgi:hypothetical protein
MLLKVLNFKDKSDFLGHFPKTLSEFPKPLLVVILGCYRTTLIRASSWLDILNKTAFFILFAAVTRARIISANLFLFALGFDRTPAPPVEHLLS